MYYLSRLTNLEMNQKTRPYIRHYNADINFRLKGALRLKNGLRHLFEQEQKPLRGLSYIFCSDDYLLEINKKHLQHDDFTDIITFDLSDDDTITGEIYISIDRIRENAKVFNTDFPAELARVMIHGALHLCGYGDKTPSEQQQMRSKEDQYLKQIMQCST